ncbi:MAG TPA: LD-carboxypeptidase [Terriglobales bacterium]|jgi:muramoyltetrapeptide carboxypeptidase|nr:LD-carboxypeptidase [Terriglobales bacterium]
MTIATQPERIRPAALQPGDTVGIIAPASGFRRDEFEAGCAELLRLGYEPFYLPSIFERALYFAGPPERRVHELHEMFRRPAVKAILCARGGYGCNYLLPLLDLDLIRANPKIFVGCSDVTTLLTYLCDAAKLVTFHGPMVAGDLARPGGIDERSWLTALSSGEAYERQFSADEVQPLARGSAEGVLYGGCLSLLVASLGTPYEISTKGTILFIEDRAERPYRIDRMLMQLKLAGKFEGVQGIIFGEMIDCEEPGARDYTLQQIVMRILADLRIPIAFGLKSGHVSSGSMTLPFGIPAKLSVGEIVSLSYGPAVMRERAAIPGQSMGRARS